MIGFFANGRSSGRIRADQMAERLGEPLDRTDLPDGATRIYVKLWPQPDWPEGSYLDVLDGIALRDGLRERPDLKPIAFTNTSREYLRNYLRRDDILLIPQWHCNFDNEIRPDREVRVVGFVGAPSSFDLDVVHFQRVLAEYGLEFRYFILRKRMHVTREDVVEFLRGIDIQVYFRAKAIRYTFRRFKDCLKIVNAGSFMMPTVGTTELNADLEFSGGYVPVGTFDEAVEACVSLSRDTGFYSSVASRAHELSQPFHIDRIAGMYRELDGA